MNIHKDKKVAGLTSTVDTGGDKLDQMTTMAVYF